MRLNGTYVELSWENLRYFTSLGLVNVVDNLITKLFRNAERIEIKEIRVVEK